MELALQKDLYPYSRRTGERLSCLCLNGYQLHVANLLVARQEENLRQGLGVKVYANT